MSDIKVKVGIIGGSGLDDPDLIQDRVERVVTTPYGNPSDCLIEGTIRGVPCVLLARHGRNHSIMPSTVNYRANIWALRHLGCTNLLVTTAVGSLREDLPPGSLVIVDNFIDRTTRRALTFYDGNESSPRGVCHVPMEPAFCPRSRRAVIDTARALGLEGVHERATVVTIEGPRFSSRAESLMFRAWGCDLVNMTLVPEVVLAKEAGLCYAAIALVTDYDCWREEGRKVCVADVMATFKQNVERVTRLLVESVECVGKQDWTDTINELRNTVNESIMLPHNS